MAENYSVKGIAHAIIDGSDIETLNDVSRRYPAVTRFMCEAKAAAPQLVLELCDHLPDFITARKVEKAYQNPVEENDKAEDEEEEAPAPKRTQKHVTKKPAKVDEPEDDDEDEDKEDGPYAGKNAMELYKECKSRKLKVAQRKPAKYYVEQLEKDDAKQEVPAPAADADDEDDDDWDI